MIPNLAMIAKNCDRVMESLNEELHLAGLRGRVTAQSELSFVIGGSSRSTLST